MTRVIETFAAGWVSSPAIRVAVPPAAMIHLGGGAGAGVGSGGLSAWAADARNRRIVVRQ